MENNKVEITQELVENGTKTLEKMTGPMNDQQKKELACALIGHSRVVNVCFGEVTCARCGALLGDTYVDSDFVTEAGGHMTKDCDCPGCHIAYKTMTWRDTYLVEGVREPDKSFAVAKVESLREQIKQKRNMYMLDTSLNPLQKMLAESELGMLELTLKSNEKSLKRLLESWAAYEAEIESERRAAENSTSATEGASGT